MRNVALLCAVVLVSAVTGLRAQAPAAPDSENTILREQVALLKKALADKQKEVDALKARLAALEGQIVPATLDAYFKAIRDNNLAAVRAGLALNPHWLDIKSGGGWSPLTAAVAEGRKEMVEFLLAKGAVMNDKDAKGNVIPIVSENPEIIAILRTHGAIVEAPPKERWLKQPGEGGGVWPVGRIR